MNNLAGTSVPSDNKGRSTGRLEQPKPLKRVTVAARPQDRQAPHVLQQSETPPTSLLGRDLIPRLRDKSGHRQRWKFTHRIPRTDQMPVERTPLKGVIESFRAKLPLRAGILHHYFDHVLLNVLDQSHKVRNEEEAMLQANNRRFAEENARIEAHVVNLEAQRDEATRNDRESLVMLDQPLQAAHAEAAERVAAVGGCYDPMAPDEACAVRVTPRPLEEVAAEMQLGWVPGDTAVRLTSGIAWALTVGMGLLIGISLGVTTNFVQPDTIGRQPLVALVAAAAGVVIATLGRYAVKPVFYLASERHALGRPLGSWLPLLLIAVGLGGFTVLLDAFVERQGLLRFVALDQATLTIRAGHASRTADPAADPIYLLVGIVMTSPYVACAALDGFLAGRYHAIDNRLRRQQSEEFETRDRERRDDPKVQAALAPIARAREILRRQEALQGRVLASASPFEEKITTLKAKLQPLQDDLDERAYRRIQDTQDDVEGAQAKWDTLLEAACSEVEPGAHPERSRSDHSPSGTQNRGIWRRLLAWWK